jgi:hypothetical protein
MHQQQGLAILLGFRGQIETADNVGEFTTELVTGEVPNTETHV